MCVCVVCVWTNKINENKRIGAQITNYTSLALCHRGGGMSLPIKNVMFLLLPVNLTQLCHLVLIRFISERTNEAQITSY